MTAYERGDVILVPFPFSDQSAAKKRPAAVVSSDHCNSSSQDLVIMAITSQTEKSTGVGGSLIHEWEKAGLLKPSAVKPALSTIEKTLIIKKLGKLSAKDPAAMENALGKLLDLR